MSLDTLTDFSDIFNTDMFSSSSSSSHSSPSSRSASPKTPPNLPMDAFTPFLTTDDGDKPFDPMSMFTTSTDYLSQSYSPSSSTTTTLTSTSSAAPPVSADNGALTALNNGMDIDSIDPSLAAFLSAFQSSQAGFVNANSSASNGTSAGGEGLFGMPELALAMQQQQLFQMQMQMQQQQFQQQQQLMQTIDPQLVGTPASSGIVNDSDFGGDEEDLHADDEDADESLSADSPPPATTKATKKGKGKKAADKSTAAAVVVEEPQEKLTLTIQPMKVAGHGKGGRKGTVASGGVVKKSSNARDKLSSPPPPPVMNKLVSQPTAMSMINEEFGGSEDGDVGVNLGPETTFASGLPASAYYPTRLYPTKDSDSNKDDKDDDLPQDWRPPPEVFQKMSSKEKRQLRNKISARNFRVRRKEYISTLEYDIAERDRLLDVIRTELGSTQSENLALRQEIATLKKTLLDGRGSGSGMMMDTGLGGLAGLTLPPPAPLPARSAAEVLAMQAAAAAASASVSPSVTLNEAAAPTEVIAPQPIPASATSSISSSLSTSTAQSTSSPLLTPNTQKDLAGNGGSSRFWGGLGMGPFGGVTPVHRMVVPEIGVDVALSPTLAAVKEVNSTGLGGERRRGLQENMNPMLNTIISNLGGSGIGGGKVVPLGESKVVNSTAAREREREREREGMPKSWFAPSVFAPSPSSSSPSPPPTQQQQQQQGGGGGVLGGFDGYADMNPFTMKTMDAYRMHLWGKMAQQRQDYSSLHPQPQQSNHQQQQVPQWPNSANTTPGSSPGGSPNMGPSPFTFGYGQQQQQGYGQQQGGYGGSLAGGLRPAFFSSPGTLSALLSGKGSSVGGGSGTSPTTPGSGNGAGLPPYSPPPPPYSSSSPVLIAKAGTLDRAERERAAERAREAERERQKERQEREVQVAAATIANQTLFRKLGGAFWDAFAGSSSGSASSSSSSSASSTSSAHASTSGSGSGSASATGVVATSTNPTNFQGQRNWDADKVRKVLEGKAVVRVVDIEDLPRNDPSSSAARIQARKEKECTMSKTCTDLLEESMRGLSLAGKKA